MSFAPVAPSSSAPQFPAYHRPTDQVIKEFPTVPAIQSDATEQSVFAWAEQLAHSLPGGNDVEILPSSYTGTPFTHVYAIQKYHGLPLLNTQLHLTIAKEKVVQANSSFRDLNGVTETHGTDDVELLSLAQVGSIVKNQFMDSNAAEWLGAGFEQTLAAKGTVVASAGFSKPAVGELGWYVTSDNALVKVWQITTTNGNIVANAKNGQVIAFNSHIAY
ncbi:hypothetical protein HDU79_009739 [Rhizoclosmatium sp. JEL0117]|nr:hypothetical protein HDU79_009739 [Rhizoclosmatium sp. JEL0117]